MTELAALRNDLLQGGMVDSYEAAELLRVFLMGRGYGVSSHGSARRGGTRRNGRMRHPSPPVRTGEPGDGDVGQVSKFRTVSEFQGNTPNLRFVNLKLWNLEVFAYTAAQNFAAVEP